MFKSFLEELVDPLLTSTNDRLGCLLSSCRVLSSFIVGLFNLYEDLFFTYLEINPLGMRIVLIFTLSAARMGHFDTTMASRLYYCIRRSIYTKKRRLSYGLS